MEIKFPVVCRVDLNVAPVDWQLECRNCARIFKNFRHINRNFRHTLSNNCLLEHSVYCNDCVPEMHQFVLKGNKLGQDVPHVEKLHICNRCCLVSRGIDEIDENVHPKRGTKSEYQSMCKGCSRKGFDEIGR